MSSYDDEQDALKTLLGGIRPEVRLWWTEHGPSFMDAVGVSSADDEVMLLILSRIGRLGLGEFPAWKDDIDRARCDVLRDVLQGTPVDDQALRLALSALMQSFSAACEENWSLRRRLEEQRRYRERQHPYPRVGPSRRAGGAR